MLDSCHVFKFCSEISRRGKERSNVRSVPRDSRWFPLRERAVRRTFLSVIDFASTELKNDFIFFQSSPRTHYVFPRRVNTFFPLNMRPINLELKVLTKCTLIKDIWSSLVRFHPSRTEQRIFNKLWSFFYYTGLPVSYRGDFLPLLTYNRKTIFARATTYVVFTVDRIFHEATPWKIVYHAMSNSNETLSKNTRSLFCILPVETDPWNLGILLEITAEFNI